MKTYEKVTHTFEPVYDENSRILILGTFPSVKSREQQFYYGHPQNRFWKLLAALTGWKVPKTISEKKEIVIAMIRFLMLVPRAATTARESRIGGTHMKTSMIRQITLSTMPPK